MSDPTPTQPAEQPRESHSAEDRAHLATEMAIWISDPDVIGALLRSGAMSPDDLDLLCLQLATEMREPGTQPEEWFEDSGWELLRREAVRDVIAHRVAASAEGVTLPEVRTELKRLRDLFWAARERRLGRAEVVKSV